MFMNLVKQRPRAVAAALCVAVMLYECSGPDRPGRHNAIAQVIDRTRTPFDRFMAIHANFENGIALDAVHYRALIKFQRTWTMSSADILASIRNESGGDSEEIRTFLSRDPPFAAGQSEVTECYYDFIRTDNGWQFQPGRFC